MSNTKYNYSRKFYTKSGQLSTEDSSDCVAKEVLNDDTSKSRFYVKCLRGKPVDVREGSFEKNKKNLEYKLVKQEVFNYYLKYLIKGGDSYLKAAERAI